MSDIFSGLICQGDSKNTHKRSLSAAPTTNKKIKKPLTLEEKNAIERKKKRQQNIQKAMRKVNPFCHNFYYNN